MTAAPALVTGATAGIGAGFARRLAADGHDLVLVSRDEHASKRWQKTSTTASVARSRCCPRTCRTRSRWPRSSHALPIRSVRSTSSSTTPVSPPPGSWRRPLDGLERELDVMVRAVLRLTRAALPPMVERQGRDHQCVVGGRVAAPGTYDAAKAWVTTFRQGSRRSPALESGPRAGPGLPTPNSTSAPTSI